jgi:hypothetical protein
MRKNINCLKSITVEAETVATTVKIDATTEDKKTSDKS